jgi:peptidoglycan/xylan/chitin deacetylase (PgdA/CDA1 family)
MSRRSFIDRAGALGAGAALAAVAPGGPAVRAAQAQTAPPTAAAGGILSPNRFDYSPIIDRPVIKWPNGARVALWVAPNVEFHEYTPLRSPNRPDIPRYSVRDYGNRQGFWRMTEVLDKHAIRACVCLNAGILDHCPEIRDAMVERDWVYMAHGFYNTRPITDYTIEQERDYWRDMIATVKKHTGKQLKGRLGAGGGNSVNTTDLMAEFGLLYHTDWMMDDQPFPLKVKNGAKFIHVPYSYQLNDQSLQSSYRDAAYFAQMIKDQFDVLYEEGATNGKVMCIALHPWFIGDAGRARYLDEALAYIRSHDAVWYTTADDIAEYYLKNYYDTVVAYVAAAKERTA